MKVNSVAYMKSIKLLEVNFVVYMATKTEVPTKIMSPRLLLFQITKT